MCNQPGCKEKSTHNYIGETNKIFCSKHKKENMINLKNNYCETCLDDFKDDNTKKLTVASYNYAFGSRARFCAKHKMAKMVDVSSTKCKVCVEQNVKNPGIATYLINGKKTFCSNHKTEDSICCGKKCIYVDENGKKCTTSPSFNFPEENKTLYCSAHKLKGMINVKSLKCKTCKTEAALYNVVGNNKPFYCSNCKTEDMVSVYKKQCLHKGCENTAHFGDEERGKLYCSKHKEDKMKNLCYRRCQTCGITASYGFDVRTRCAEHKEEGMKDLKHKTCEICGIGASFNFEGKKQGIRCSEHKLEGMIDVKHPDCIFPGCPNKASYGVLFCKKVHCSTHKLKGEIAKNNPKCEIENCGEKPFYTNIENNIPLRCEHHRIKEDKNIVEQACSNCFLTSFIREGGTCDDCLEWNNPNIRKAKELKIKALFDQSGFEYLSHDKVPKGGCHKKRPDFVFDYLWFKVIVEVDENQHASYDCKCNKEKYDFSYTHSCECELKRMIAIHQDIGQNLIFIRYNPDTYKDNLGKKIISNNLNSREKILLDLLSNLKNDSIKKAYSHKGLVVYYLFYDGFDEKNIKSFTIRY
jgi:hypothetical protein